MSHSVVRVHKPDLSVIELQFDEGTSAGTVIGQIREGCRLGGGFLKCEGVIVGTTSSIVSGKLYDFTDAIPVIGDSNLSQQMAIMSLMVSRITESVLNPWCGDRDVRNVDPTFRATLKSALGIQSKFVPCMISSQMGGADQVIVANILPSNSQTSVLHELQLDRNDLSGTRNALFLAANIHRCFERLQLSFIPVSQSHAHNFSYKMVLHDPAVASMSIWDGHKSTIGMFVDHYLNIAGHSPFRRALAYQAYMAYTQQILTKARGRPMPESMALILDQQQTFESIYREDVLTGHRGSA